MSFSVPAPLPAVLEDTIVSGPFWPEIEPAEIRQAQRIDGSVTPERLRDALIEAIASTNGELRAYRQARLDEGYAKLERVSAEEIDGVSILVHRYRRAVGCLAKALLLERLRDFDTTGAGDKKADAACEPIDDCRRDYRNAIADIAGTGRVTVELI